MNISELSLKRPILATVLNILIVLFGIVGYTFLAVRDYPAIDPPTINVRTSYAGANADIIESQITEPLEKVINIMVGDLQRIKIYPAKGFQTYQQIPDDVWQAYERLVELGFDKQLIEE